MNLDVIFTANDCSNEKVKNKNAVVIDVLRATSVITTALINGASKVKTFKEISEVQDYAKTLREEKVLGGERFALKIDDFDFGNSPLDYVENVVKNKEVVITTSNGTVAIENSLEAKNLYIGSFLNSKAVAKKIDKDNLDTVIVCAGTNGNFTLDDALCAGIIIQYLCDLTQNLTLTDSALFTKNYFFNSNKDLNSILSESYHYNFLLKSGFKNDLDYCLQLDITNSVPYYKNGSFIL